MSKFAPEAARWLRPEPRCTIPISTVQQIVRIVLPHRSVVGIERFRDGFRNANFKVQLDSAPDMVVLRLYEHDPSLCQKELDIFHLVRDSVPVPCILYAEPAGTADLPPFMLLEYVQGIGFRELKRNGGREAVAQAAYSAGQTLAAIGRITFAKSGWLAPAGSPERAGVARAGVEGPTVTNALTEGPDPLPRFVDQCLASGNLQRRLDADLRESIHRLFWQRAEQLARLDNEACLVHCDFGKRNLLMREVAGKWSVAAVLDWEFAVAGSPLIDVGHFLRYERNAQPLLEPHFSTGFQQAGGKLPGDWRRLSRIIDLSALCESLTHDDLPQPVEAELIELARATVENRDHQVP